MDIWFVILAGLLCQDLNTGLLLSLCCALGSKSSLAIPANR